LEQRLEGDVLNGFETIQVCDKYSIDGESSDNIPFDLSHSNYIPQYHSIAGWQDDLKDFSFDNLPVSLVNYIAYLEEKLEVPISIISVGPGRNELIDRGTPAIA